MSDEQSLGDQQHLAILIDAAPIAILVVDDAGRIALINAQVEKLFGYERSELLGEPVEKLVPMRYTAAHPMLRRGYASEPSSRPMGAGRDLFALRKDGAEVPVEIGLSPIETPQGRFFLATVSDISERKHAEEIRLMAVREERRRIDAEADRDRAVDASHLKSQFVATMSHELRTPLNAIIGMAELLSRTELPHPLSDFVVKINESAEALLGIISGILEFSKIEAGKLELEIDDFDLEEVVGRCADVLFQQARQKGIALHTYIDPLIPHVLQGDSDRLGQVLMNLIGNAIKFTERGHVVVRALPVESKPAWTTIRFEVEDTGVGIEEDVLPKLFEPFVQADSSSSRRFGGTGLGLSISKRLVELMNGEIGVASEAGSGSLFWFTARFAVPRHVSPTHRMSGVGVVIAVRDDALAAIVERYLAAWGMQSRRVRTVDDLTEALIAELRAEAGSWVVVVDAEGEQSTALGATLRELARIDPSRIVPIGGDPPLNKPLRQSALFDGIVNVLQMRPAPPAALAAVSPNGEPHDGALILVAEDNAAMHEVLVHQFGELGVMVKIVTDGAEAAAAVQREPYALVFMDCHMPRVDGYEATRLIRDAERATGRHVPIVAMTANAFKEDREACLAAGMDDYLAKPVRLRDLRAMLQRWLPPHG